MTSGYVIEEINISPGLGMLFALIRLIELSIVLHFPKPDKIVKIYLMEIGNRGRTGEVEADAVPEALSRIWSEKCGSIVIHMVLGYAFPCVQATETHCCLVGPELFDRLGSSVTRCSAASDLGVNLRPFGMPRSAYRKQQGCTATGTSGNDITPSKHPDEPVPRLHPQEWSAFLTGIRDGEFDLP